MTVAYMDQLTDKVDDIDEKVTSILTLLQGNALDKSDRGVIGKIGDMGKRLDALEDWKKSINRYSKGILIGAAITSSIGIMKVLEIAMDLLKHLTK